MPERDQHGAVREKTGYSLAGARQWIPRKHLIDPVISLVTSGSTMLGRVAGTCQNPDRTMTP